MITDSPRVFGIPARAAHPLRPGCRRATSPSTQAVEGEAWGHLIHDNFAKK